MYVDFTALNVAFPKTHYPFPNINCLIDGSSGYQVLSFMNAYLGYNQIKMDSLDAPKTAFMSNQGNYYYNDMTFGLTSTDTTCQRCMDVVFTHQIKQNLEVYVDDMIIKTT